MASFQDLSESSTARWVDILTNSGIEFNPHEFPFKYYERGAKEFGLSEGYLNEVVEENPRRANVVLIYYAVYPLMKSQIVKFFSDPELNVEFSNLISSARNHQLKLEV